MNDANIERPQDPDPAVGAAVATEPPPPRETGAGLNVAAGILAAVALVGAVCAWFAGVRVA